MMFQPRAGVARQFWLFTIQARQRNIPAMRTGVLIVVLLFTLSDWGGQRHSARYVPPGRIREQPVATFPLGANTNNPSVAFASLNPPAGSRDSKSRVDFEAQIKPILQSKCMPCHFTGGTMYERLPFDRAETIKKLGTKLFTRIQDENHRRLIREFLEQ
jgi:hypothetical protein